ncbi:MAG: hypothetical protein HZB99_01665 [Candidatus Harrisonbacteria bacterium]|nr:hypothetical protein [Candidatus Harrisonbacteria bacterium]
MKNAGKVSISLFLALTISSCASLGSDTKQLKQERKSLNTLVKQGEVLLVTVENDEHDLVPICGKFLTSNEKGIYLYHLDGERFYEKIDKVNSARTGDWFRVEDWPAIGIKWKRVRYVEYCLRNTSDRKPLYYDP